MKILFDNNVPTYLLPLFAEHDATTAFRMGWHELANGRLLDAMQASGFELLVTLDGGFQYQQNLSGRPVSVAILEPGGQSREEMLAVGADLVLRLQEISPGLVTTVSRRTR